MGTRKIKTNLTYLTTQFIYFTVSHAAMGSEYKSGRFICFLSVFIFDSRRIKYIFAEVGSVLHEGWFMMVMWKDVYIWPGYKTTDLLFGKARSIEISSFNSSFSQNKNVLCFWDLLWKKDLFTKASTFSDVDTFIV